MILALVLFCVIYLIDGYLYHQQTPFAQTAYRIFSGILCALGIIGTLGLRAILQPHLLRECADIERHFDFPVIEPILADYDRFALLTGTALVLLITVLLLAQRYGKPASLARYPGWVVFGAGLLLNGFAVWYGLAVAFSKFFDVGSYILLLAQFEIFALHLPLAVRRPRQTPRF